MGVGIDASAMGVVGKFETTVLQIGHSVDFVGLEQPRRKMRRSETRVPRRSAEEKNFLTSGENARREEFRKNLAEPRATGKDVASGGDALAGGGFDKVESFCGVGRRLDLGDA